MSARSSISVFSVVFASALLLLSASEARATSKELLPKPRVAPPVPTVGEVIADGAKRFAQLNADALDVQARRLQHLLGVKTVEDLLRERDEAILRELLAEVARRMRAATPLLGQEGPDTNFMQSKMRRTKDD
jgi:hypothetical protein